MFDLRRALGVLQTVCGMPDESVLDEGRLLDGEDIAEYLGVSLWWVRNKFIKLVPPKKVGRLNRWESWQVRAYLDRSSEG